MQDFYIMGIWYRSYGISTVCKNFGLSMEYIMCTVCASTRTAMAC